MEIALGGWLPVILMVRLALELWKASASDTMDIHDPAARLGLQGQTYISTVGNMGLSYPDGYYRIQLVHIWIDKLLHRHV